MERVQFQQEQMLAELKDLTEKGLFSSAEIKQVMKKRTAFETALIRRIPKKADFLRYAQYEMGLEALRKKRVKRMKLPKSQPSISDFAILRRQFAILERALRKFKDDLALWLFYIRLASASSSRALAGRLCARALSLHPTCGALYVLAADHELRHGGFHAARVLLQRGARMAEGVEIWREMVRLEMGFIAVVKKRWEILGLALGEGGIEEGGEQLKDVEMPDENISSGQTQAEDTLTSALAEAATANPGERGNNGDEGAEDEQARKAVLGGELVKAVISNAVKAIPSYELFFALHSIITTQPCQLSLRRSLLTFLHELLRETLLSRLYDLSAFAAGTISSSSTAKPSTTLTSAKDIAPAALLYATRFLTPALEAQGGERLVDALRQANEDFVETYKAAVALQLQNQTLTSALGKTYTTFISEWVAKEGLDENLKLYLLTSLQSLCSSPSPSKHTLSHPSPSLLSAHLTLLSSPFHPAPPPRDKVRKLAKKYNSRAPADGELWLVRLELEAEASDEDREAMEVWTEARKSVLAGLPLTLVQSGGEEAETREKEVEDVWLWGVERMEKAGKGSEVTKLLETLLRSALSGLPSSRRLVDTLIIRHLRHLLARACSAIRSGTYKTGSLASEVQRVANSYCPGENVWAATFDVYAGAGTNPSDTDSADMERSDSIVNDSEAGAALQAIFALWRASASSPAAAALRWGEWLVRRGRGREAAHVIADAQTALSGPGQEDERSEFEMKWRGVLDSIGSEEREEL